MQLCPCESGKLYGECCAPYHLQQKQPENAEQLMRSRYSAYALQQIDYIMQTTVPSQRALIVPNDVAAWARSVGFMGLVVHRHVPKIGAKHAQVEFTAQLQQNGQIQPHHELSSFVNIDGAWYFIDPTVWFPSMKSPCICGSGKKFKACCGQFFR